MVSRCEFTNRMWTRVGPGDEIIANRIEEVIRGNNIAGVLSWIQYSATDLAKRVNAALDLLLSRHRNESIAIVAHSGVIRLLLGQALAMSNDQIFRLSQRYGAINRIKYSEHGPIVELVNG